MFYYSYELTLSGTEEALCLTVWYLTNDSVLCAAKDVADEAAVCRSADVDAGRCRPTYRLP